MNHASVAHKISVQRTKLNKTRISKNGIVENSLRILDLCRTPETDSTNPWGSIESKLRTTGLDSTVAHLRYEFKQSFYILTVLTYTGNLSEM